MLNNLEGRPACLNGAADFIFSVGAIKCLYKSSHWIQRVKMHVKCQLCLPSIWITIWIQATSSEWGSSLMQTIQIYRMNVVLLVNVFSSGQESSWRCHRNIVIVPSVCVTCRLPFIFDTEEVENTCCGRMKGLRWIHQGLCSAVVLLTQSRQYTVHHHHKEATAYFWQIKLQWTRMNFVISVQLKYRSVDLIC